MPTPAIVPAGRERPAPERAAVIDLETIRHNVRRLLSLVEPAQLMAVVKADAYGHGAESVANAALEAGAHWLGVAHVSEALTLRTTVVGPQILAWLHTPSTDFAAALTADIDLACSGWELAEIVAAAHATGRTARIHLKIDTGLGRNGSTEEKWERLVQQALLRQNEGLIRVVGVFSHLAVADEPGRPETDEQIARFRRAVATAEQAGLTFEVRHLANSPAILSRPDTHFDLVRAGLALYGLSPFPGTTSAALGLLPAMTMVSQLAGVKNVPAGQGVSYGLKYVTPVATVLGLIPVGYADGIPRAATGAPVLLNGVVYPVVGTIAMDQMVIDLGPDGHDPAAGVGSDIVLFGDGARGAPSIDDWAAAAGTINYEVVTRISPRVPRLYRNKRDSPDMGSVPGTHL